MLAAVGWSWLTEALEAHGASYATISGTVTRVSTESFGDVRRGRDRADRDPRLLDAVAADDAPARSTSPRRRGVG